MKLSNTEGTGVGRRGFLRLSGGLLATTAATTGCLNADADTDDAEIGYRNWIPATFDPIAMYVDVNVLSEHHSMWEGGGDEQYGLNFDDVAEIVGASDAEILVLEEGAAPEPEGDEVGEHRGYTVYESDSEVGGFVASDGDAVIEAQTQDSIESVVDAHAGDAARLHEEDEVFEGLTTKAGEGDIVVVPRVDGRRVRRREARAADVSEGTSEVRIAIEADEDEFPDTADELREREHMTIEEVVERDTEAGIIVLRGTVETQSIPEAFGLVATGSGSQGAHEEESNVDEGGAPDSEGVAERDSVAESGSMSEGEGESESEGDSESMNETESG